MRAGLIPALQQNRIAKAAGWSIATMFPRTNPFLELEIALRAVAVKLQPDLLDLLLRDSNGLVRVSRLVLPRDCSLLLVIDQFEEIFTLVEDSAQARRFMDTIYTAVTDPRSTIRVIITLRADFLDRPLMYPDFSWLVQDHTAMVIPMTPDELERTITLPAQQAHVSLDPGLVARLVAEANEQPGALPLLEFALTELYDQRIGRTITMHDYGEIGGLHQALATQADRVYDDLTDFQQEATRQLFLRLITLGEGTEDVRRRVPVRELASLNMPSGTMAYLTNFLTANRLLTTDLDPATREPTVEVAHEALIREWGRLREWLDESRHNIRQQRLLAAAAAEWQQHNQDTSYLLLGSRLDQFAAWSDETNVALTDDERVFLDASILERQRQLATELERQQREVALARRSANRPRYLIAAMSVFLVIAVILVGITNNALGNATTERDKAQRQAYVNHSLVLATDAQKAYDSDDSELALALALEAVNLDDPPPETIRALADLAYAPGTQQVFVGHTGPVFALAVSADGRYALSGAGRFCPDCPTEGDYSVRLWEMASGEEIRRFEGHTDGVTDVAMTSDNHTVVSSSIDGSLIVWDIDGGDERCRFEDHRGHVVEVEITPDNRRALSRSYWLVDDTGYRADSEQILWDIETCQEIRRFDFDLDLPNLATRNTLKILPNGRSALVTELEENQTGEHT